MLHERGGNAMATITIKAPADLDCDMKAWKAEYGVFGTLDAKLISIESRSAIDVVVAKITREMFFSTETSYYISSPNFQVAIPPIPSLLENSWITEKLIEATMPVPDAVTVAQVLQDVGDF